MRICGAKCRLDTFSGTGDLLNSLDLICDLEMGHAGDHEADWGSMYGPTRWRRAA